MRCVLSSRNLEALIRALGDTICAGEIGAVGQLIGNDSTLSVVDITSCIGQICGKISRLSRSRSSRASRLGRSGRNRLRSGRTVGGTEPPHRQPISCTTSLGLIPGTRHVTIGKWCRHVLELNSIAAPALLPIFLAAVDKVGTATGILTILVCEIADSTRDQLVFVVGKSTAAYLIIPAA